jgi:hypothetical protein
MYKIGDLVVYVAHSDSHPTDKEVFKIGKVYKVKKLDEINPHVLILGIKHKINQVFDYQVKKLENNAMNRLLYPEVDWSKYV